MTGCHRQSGIFKDAAARKKAGKRCCGLQRYCFEENFCQETCVKLAMLLFL